MDVVVALEVVLVVEVAFDVVVALNVVVGFVLVFEVEVGVVRVSVVVVVTPLTELRRTFLVVVVVATVFVVEVVTHFVDDEVTVRTGLRAAEDDSLVEDGSGALPLLRASVYCALASRSGAGAERVGATRASRASASKERAFMMVLIEETILKL